jgi:LacI family transcriptional regulator
MAESSISRATRAERVTIREIADEAAVSIATVSRVLNNRADVSDETRELVQRVIRKRGYRSNRNAQTLPAGRTGLVGVLVPLVHPEYFSTILSGVAEALYDQDMRLILSPTDHLYDREVSLLERLTHGATDGALIVLPEEEGPDLEHLLVEGFPFVVVDPRTRLAERIPTVSAAHAAGADQAMRHLLELGHRRIGVITGIPDWVASERRLQGYHAGLAGASIPPDPELIVAGDWEIGGGMAAAERLLSLPEPPTAIFAFNDNMAVGAIRVARARGLRVPEELSVVGFDDVEFATVVAPGLTTIRQPLAELGRMGVDRLVRLLQGRRLEAMNVELGTRLVVRESTAPAPIRAVSSRPR